MRFLLCLLLAFSAFTEEYQLRVKVTAYCPCEICCKGSCDGKTSTGKVVKCLRTGHIPMPDCWGVAAAAGRFPKGTRIIIPGFKPSRYYPADHAWPVDDTGQAMNDSRDAGIDHIDIRFIHHKHAKNWGEKWLTVTVITPDRLVRRDE